jgi:thiol-disulfide isomerase/thioredoxin
MKKISYLITLLTFGSIQCQENNFIPEGQIALDRTTYFEFVQKKRPKTQLFLPDGKELPLKKLDSLNKTIHDQPFTTIFYADTLQNKASLVLKYLSKEDVKLRNDKFRQQQKDFEKNRRKLIGSTLTEFSLTDIEGKTYTLEDLKGKVIFLNFWFTQCKPCIEEMPDLNTLKEKYKNQNVVFFAVTYNEKKLIQDFLKRTSLELTIIPNDRKTIDQFHIAFYPTNILIDTEGKVLFINELMGGNGLKDIKKLLNKMFPD